MNRRALILTAYSDHRRYDHQSQEQFFTTNEKELNALLQDGWEIESVSPMGGAGGAGVAIGGASAQNDYRQFSSFAALVILNKSTAGEDQKTLGFSGIGIADV